MLLKSNLISAIKTPCAESATLAHPLGPGVMYKSVKSLAYYIGNSLLLQGILENKKSPKTRGLFTNPFLYQPISNLFINTQP
jgi:hypothetical protein